MYFIIRASSHIKRLRMKFKANDVEFDTVENALRHWLSFQRSISASWPAK